MPHHVDTCTRLPKPRHSHPSDPPAPPTGARTLPRLSDRLPDSRPTTTQLTGLPAAPPNHLLRTTRQPVPLPRTCQPPSDCPTLPRPICDQTSPRQPCQLTLHVKAPRSDPARRYDFPQPRPRRLLGTSLPAIDFPAPRTPLDESCHTRPSLATIQPDLTRLSDAVPTLHLPTARPREPSPHRRVSPPLLAPDSATIRRQVIPARLVNPVHAAANRPYPGDYPIQPIVHCRLFAPVPDRTARLLDP